MPSEYNDGKKLERSEQKIRQYKRQNPATSSNDATTTVTAADNSSPVGLYYQQEIELQRRRQREQQINRIHRMQQTQQQQQKFAYYAMPTVNAHTAPVQIRTSPGGAGYHQPQMMVGKYVLQYAPVLSARNQGNHGFTSANIAAAARSPTRVATAAMPVARQLQLNAQGTSNRVAMPVQVPVSLANTAAVSVRVARNNAGAQASLARYQSAVETAAAVADQIVRTPTRVQPLNNTAAEDINELTQAMSPTFNLNLSPQFLSPPRKQTQPQTQPQTQMEIEMDTHGCAIVDVNDAEDEDDEVQIIETRKQIDIGEYVQAESESNDETEPETETAALNTTVNEVPIELMPKSSTHGFVVPTDISDIVMRASSVVAEEIRTCHLRYYKTSRKDLSDNSDGDEETYESKARTAAAAVEQFTKDIILPSILSSHAANIDIIVPSEHKDTPSLKIHDLISEDKHMNTNPNTISQKGHERQRNLEKGPYNAQRIYNRILIATLLSLREVLVINGKRIFGLSEEEDDDVESYAVKVQSLVTSLILNATMRLDDAVDDRASQDNKGSTRKPNSNSYITNEMLRSLAQYDGAGEEFVSCLKRKDTRAMGIMPNGKLMKKTENLAYRVSFNTSRLDHHLITKSRTRESSVYGVETPIPDAAFVSVVEHIPNPIVTVESKKRIRDKTRQEVLDRYRERMRNIKV